MPSPVLGLVHGTVGLGDQGVRIERPGGPCNPDTGREIDCRSGNVDGGRQGGVYAPRDIQRLNPAPDPRADHEELVATQPTDVVTSRTAPRRRSAAWSNS